MIASPFYDTSVKLNMTHNISSSCMNEIRMDLNMTIWEIKLQAEKRYGSDPQQVSLSLKDRQGNTLHLLNNDGAYLNIYNPQDGYTIHVVDKNPFSILKGLEDVSQIQKYTMNDEEYNKLPESFRKFKQTQLQNQQNQAAGNKEEEKIKEKMNFDDEFEKDIALQLTINQRCQIIKTNNRGKIRYIGQIPQLGLGYFIGLQMDEPCGTNNGTIKGYAYFACPPKYGVFLRPSEVEVGNFPELDLDDEI